MRRCAKPVEHERNSRKNDPGCHRHQRCGFSSSPTGWFDETVLNLAVGGEVRLFASASILAEYEEVLRRPYLGIDLSKITRAIAGIRAAASMVTPGDRVTAALDPDDNIFLECAQAANAKYLVTGNVKHFPESWDTTRIVTPRQFVDAWAANAE